jgi:hypothetical protein
MRRREAEEDFLFLKRNREHAMLFKETYISDLKHISYFSDGLFFLRVWPCSPGYP